MVYMTKQVNYFYHPFITRSTGSVRLIAGHWAVHPAPRPGAHWVPGHWAPQGRWIPGRWK